jgi:hypothetical protein
MGIFSVGNARAAERIVRRASSKSIGSIAMLRGAQKFGRQL